MITGRQIAAARALLGATQKQLAEASAISIPTLKRMEASEGDASGMKNNVSAVVQALINMGIVFISENGGGYGVRLKDRQ